MSFNPQVRVFGEEKFHGNGLFFATAEEALAYARDLQGRWTMTRPGEENRRAFESDQPVNYRWTDKGLVAVEEAKQ